MAASGSIMPNPKWYFVDNYGEPLGSGYLYTYRSLDKTQYKYTFSDAGLTLPYTDPIRIDANGTFGPIFWANDEPYYIVVTDVNGYQIWDMDNFWPTIAGGGGGGNTTTYINIQDLIPNNTFYRNDVVSDGSTNTITPVPAFLTIAPGGHAGFYGNTALATTTGSPAPDICFMKSNSAASDTLTMGTFPLGSNALTGNVTPVYYLRYASNASAASFKMVQFPICSQVQNLSNQTVTGLIWVAWNSGSNVLTLQWRQFFGDGPSASPDQTASTTITLSTSSPGTWTPYQWTLSVPNASGKSLGECGNDGLFFQVLFPNSAACDISIAKPKAYLGTNIPPIEFYNNDAIESVVNNARTGDIRTSINSFAPYGWVPMNDGTIGSASSGATTRANRDSFPLYATLWNNVSDTYAPVTGGRGSSASADFAANKPIALTKMLGRALASQGAGSGLTTRTLGETVGSETISIAAMPSHNHPGSLVSVGTGASTGTVGNNGQTNTGSQSLTIASQGGGAADGNMPPTTFYNVFMKL